MKAGERDRRDFLEDMAQYAEKGCILRSNLFSIGSDRTD